MLLNSMSAKGHAFEEALTPFGESAGIAMAEHLQHGGTARTSKIELMLERILGRKPGLEELDLALRRFETLVVSKVLSCPEMPGATEALVELSTKSHLYAISATPTEELTVVLHARGWTPYLSGIYGFPQHKSEVMQRLLRTCGYRREMCVMIGDTSSDRNAAAEVSVPFILVSSPYGPHPVPGDVAAIEDLTSLPTLIERHWSGT